MRWRLSDEDWKLFGGPEWLILDWDAFEEMPWKDLDALEADMGMSIRRAKLNLADGTARGIKAALWLARQTSGDPALKIGWDEFDLIRPLKAKAEAVDADPPAQSSPAATAGEQTPAPDSSSSSAEAEPSETSTPA